MVITILCFDSDYPSSQTREFGSPDENAIETEIIHMILHKCKTWKGKESAIFNEFERISS